MVVLNTDQNILAIIVNTNLANLYFCFDIRCLAFNQHLTRETITNLKEIYQPLKTSCERKCESHSVFPFYFRCQMALFWWKAAFMNFLICAQPQYPSGSTLLIWFINTLGKIYGIVFDFLLNPSLSQFLFKLPKLLFSGLLLKI